MKTKLLFLAIMAFSLAVTAQHDTYWEEHNLGLDQTWKGADAVVVVDENVIWATIRDGRSAAESQPILDYVKSVDGGATWTIGNVIPGNTEASLSMIYALSADLAWAAVYGGGSAQGIYKTTDGGSTWTKQPSASFSDSASFPNVVYFWDENVGFCQGDPISSTHECYTTTDGGENWEPVTGMPAVIDAEEYGTVGFYKVLDNTLWYTTVYGRIFRSYDFGHTFEVFATDVTDSQIQLAFSDQDNGYLSGPGGVLFKTSDGGETWNIQFPSTGDALAVAEMVAFPGTEAVIQAGAYSSSTYGSIYTTDGFDSFVTMCNDDQHLSIDNYGSHVWSGSYNNADLTGGMHKYIGPDISGIGIEELESKGFKTFPNPVKDVLNMVSKEEISNVEIFNILGQKVLSQNVNALTAQINTADLVNGTYIVRVTIGNVTGSMKIVK